MIEKIRNIGHWVVAGLIATAVASASLSFLLSRTGEGTHTEKPCTSKPCFISLDKRVSILESEVKIRTANRYTSQDAQRDHTIMQAELNKALKEATLLRIQVNAQQKEIAALKNQVRELSEK